MRTRAPFWLFCALVAALFSFTARAGAQASAAGEPSAREILVMLDLPPTHFKPSGSYGGSYGDTQSTVARKRTALSIARKNQLELVDSWAMPIVGVDCYVMRVPEGRSVAMVIARVSQDPRVKWSQPLQLYRGQGATPSGDPLLRASPAATQWHLSDLHRVATGRGVRIAVIDSKVDTNHPDLVGQFAADRDFVAGASSRPEQHGTAVAGVIGAKPNNGIGMVGVAPGAKMLALRACWQTSSNTLCDTLSLARALQFAVGNGAGVINLSLSGPDDLLLRKLIDIALERRITVVAAVDPKVTNGGFPASQPGVIAVTQDSLRKIPAHLYGAPGENVPTTKPGGIWDLVSGSSYAAAHVSGLAALVREERGSTPAGSLARSANGAVDACATVLRITVECACHCAATRGLAIRTR